MKNEQKKSDNLEARKKRGQITSNDLEPFKSSSYNELISMLNDKNPQKRTIAATLLSDDHDYNFDCDYVENIDKESVINLLAKSFKEEKTLYSRLAISESLVSYGELAVPSLIGLLGEIGNNQEKELPKKYFNKKSFPLPRDLAARTLANIGDVATPYLIKFLNADVINDNKNNNDIVTIISNNVVTNTIVTNFKKEQGLDAIGAIAYKSDDYRAFDSINNLFLEILSSEYSNVDEVNVFVWKIVRSLSGFRNNESALNLVIAIMERFDEVVEIQWESIRSIGQIGIVNSDVENIFKSIDKTFCDNFEVELALKISKESLGLL